MWLLYVLSHVNYEHKIKQNQFKSTVVSLNCKPYNRNFLLEICYDILHSWPNFLGNVKWKSLSCVQLFAILWTISPWNSPGQNNGMGSLSLLQGIFPTQGSNLGLQHYRQILYQLSHNGRPRILEWVAYPFSRGYSQPRNQTGVSCIVGRFFTSWATLELYMLVL